MSMQRKNYVIELFRFFFCMLIVNYHFFSHYTYSLNFPNFFARAYVGDEFFFIVSGFFLVEAAMHTDKQPVEFALSQLVRRIKKIAIPYYLTWVVCFIGSHISEAVFNQGKTDVVSDLLNSIYELTFTGMFGFMKAFYCNEAAWFFSALLIVSFILSPFAVKYKEKFSLYIAPLIALVSYGALSMFFDYLHTPYARFGTSIILKGQIRAFAAICLGCFIHGLVNTDGFKKLNKKRSDTARIISLLDILVWGGVIIYLVYPFESNNYKLDVQYDYIAVFFMFLAMIPVMGGLFTIEKKKPASVANSLGKYAYYAFCGQAMFHSVDLLVYYKTTLPLWSKFLILNGSVAVSTLFIATVDRLVKKERRRLKTS